MSSAMTNSQCKIQSSKKFSYRPQYHNNNFLLQNLLFFFALSLHISAQTICIANVLIITFPVLCGNIDLTCELALFHYLMCLRELLNGPDRVVGDSSYCKVMQCITPSPIHRAMWLNATPDSRAEWKQRMILKTMQCEPFPSIPFHPSLSKCNPIELDFQMLSSRPGFL